MREWELEVPLCLGWIVVGLLAIVDALWIAATGHTLVATGTRLSIVAAVLGLALALRSRFPRVSRSLHSLAQNLCLGATMLVLVTLAATADMPLRDAWFAAADRALGFDWGAWYDLAHRSAVAINALVILYAFVFVGQTLALVFVLPFISPERNAETILTIGCAVSICALLSMLLPAEGAIFHFGRFDPLLHSGLLVAHKTLMTLREGVTVLDYTQLNQGLIVFPSFHAASVVLYSYAARGTGRLHRVVVASNALMLSSVPFVGGHYLVDVLAGLFIATAVTSAVHFRPRTAARLPTRLPGPRWMSSARPP